MSHKQTNNQFAGNKKKEFDRNAHLARARSKIKNRDRKMNGVDGRSRASRRFWQVVHDTVRLAGDRQAPEITLQLSQQYATLVIKMEQHQSDLFNGDGRSMSDADYCKLVNSSNRCLRLLGLTKIDEGDDDGDVNALEKYIAKKNADKQNRKKDRRRERMGKNL